MTIKRSSARPLWLILGGLAMIQGALWAAETDIWSEGHVQLNQYLYGTLAPVVMAKPLLSPVQSASASLPTVASEPTPVSAVQPSSLVASTPMVASVMTCVELPGVALVKNNERVAVLTKAWKEAGLTVEMESLNFDSSPQFWIHSPPRPTREGAMAKEAEIARLGVKSLGITAFGKPPNRQYLVSLGSFDTRAEAEDFLNKVRGKGVKTALLSVLELGKQARLQLKTNDVSALRAVLEMQLPNQAIKTCEEKTSNDLNDHQKEN